MSSEGWRLNTKIFIQRLEPCDCTPKNLTATRSNINKMKINKLQSFQNLILIKETTRKNKKKQKILLRDFWNDNQILLHLMNIVQKY